MTDPAATDPVADLIRRERHAREQMAATQMWATVRRDCLGELHQALGTWQRVADATGQKLAAVHKAVRRPRKKDQ